jgi:iron complex outermembrane receptor protein
LTLTGRAIHTSSQYADAANTQTVPAWTRFDVGARYLTEVDGHLLTLRASVDNVANKNYWASAGGYPGSSYLVLGAPRTVMLSASVEF